MSSIPHPPAETVHEWSWSSRLLVREVWASLAIRRDVGCRRRSARAGRRRLRGRARTPRWVVVAIGLAIAALLVAAPVSFGGTSKKGATSCFYTPSGKKAWCVTAHNEPGWSGWYWDDGVATVVASGQWLYASEGNTELAHARRVRPGRWNVSRAADQGFGFLGSAQRRSATRWNIYHDGKLVGYTKGPTPGVVGLYALLEYL